MFPHQKLDWNISRLERQLESAPDDAHARLEFAAAAYSRARYHAGGEVWLNQALTQARRILQSDPANARALAIAGLSLVGLDRLDPAARYLDEGARVDPERAEVHLGLGAMYRRQGDRHQAVREAELACRLGPEHWECHELLSTLLRERAAEIGQPPRLLERAQFHTVRALQLGPAPLARGDLLHQLGTLCLHAGRHEAARELFQGLLSDDRYRTAARYYLGLVSYNLGKYKNAILYLRQHLQDRPDVPAVHARIAMAYMQLGEVSKAREACNRALAIDPTDLRARWTLGCALLEESRIEEACRLFKEILSDAPEHTPAFTELVRVRRDERDERWLLQALRAEVSLYDRLPVAQERPNRRGPPTQIAPRNVTRERIGTLLRAIGTLDSLPNKAILDVMDLTTDEALRFALWEAVLDRLAHTRASLAAKTLAHAGANYSSTRARDILPLASVLPDPILTTGLQIRDEDLRRAAVERHGPTHDVTVHRKNVDNERREARAWQAILLLAIASGGSRSGRNLLARWSTEADAELARAARCALVLSGDAEAIAALRIPARERACETKLASLVSHVSPSVEAFQPRPVSDDEELHCTTCGRHAPEVDHMLAGSNAVICDRCVTSIARARRELETDDPNVCCALCGRTHLEARAVYSFRGTAVCSHCIDGSLGLLEREEVDRFLAAR